MFDKVRHLFSSARRDAELQAHLDDLRSRVPVPVFWLFGKTQSGKTTLIKYLTGANDAEVGQGFRPCTRFSREYEFPTHEAPVLAFLDTRGLDEPGYDPAEDVARFRDRAHVVIVTVKAMDHAQENVLNNLRVLRRDQPSRPVVLVLTCLHEAYPQQQHPPYEELTRGETSAPADLLRSLAEQRQRFDGLVDRVVPVDIT
ncbi:MAG TPA: GTPase, partial [Gemmataceae bacterium]|nr:GTPase [Gemmataceae bacterium]